MKTAGIIGGLGPETTSKFYLEVIFSCYEKDKINRPPLLIWNVPLSYEIEENFIKNAKDGEKYIPYLIDAAKKLERGGADFIVIPCNSVHIFIDEIRNSVHIPIISIIEETANFLTNKKINDVGILATSVTLREKIYEERLHKESIKTHKPNDIDQTKMGTIINNLVHSRQSEADKEELMEIINKFEERGIKTVILACTDLQLLVLKNSDMEIFDTMEILVNATVNEILK